MINPYLIVRTGAASVVKIMMNLTQPFFGTYQFVVGKNTLNSVSTAMQFAEEDFGFIDIVKTATKTSQPNHCSKASF